MVGEAVGGLTKFRCFVRDVVGRNVFQHLTVLDGRRGEVLVQVPVIGANESFKRPAVGRGQPRLEGCHMCRGILNDGCVRTKIRREIHLG
jgi:hypothetical protein